MNGNANKHRAILERSGWADATSIPLAGDASQRRYERLQNPDGTTAILMIAPTERGNGLQIFEKIASHLNAMRLSAPQIIDRDANSGLMLLEDLGDELFARLMANDPTLESDLYFAAIDVLVELRAVPPIDCQTYDAREMARQSGIVFDWYCGVDGTGLIPALEAVFGSISSDRCLALRDYHSENLIWLAGREGTARVGLLDFQDAVIAHPAYDLVSLLQDARRDIGDGVAQKAVTYYIHQTGEDPARFGYDYAVIGVQRNLRILGVFARLSKQFHKPSYVDLIPRVWAHLMNDLSHPDLGNLRELVISSIPEPTQSHLEALRAQ